MAGGTLNVIANWDNINSAGDFLGFFAVGGTAGVAGAAASIVAPGGIITGALFGSGSGGVIGSLVGGFNNLLKGQSFWSGAKTGAIYGAATGAIFGAVNGYSIAKSNNCNIWTGKNRVVPGENSSAVQEMLSVPSDQPKPIYPENADYQKYVGEDFYVKGTLDDNVILPKGTVIDRFSSSHEGLLRGTFCGEQGTPYLNRSLLYNPAKGGVYGKMKLLQDLPVQKSIAAPILKLNIPGGGVQYQLFNPGTKNIMNIQQMLDQHYIKLLEVSF